ncbi:GtrA family protein [Streptomyces sp. NPDC016845]|uniref:GtrA family protein n=1 Tax=Streptomyces sp. NPDC016845 TaxID=3364972 RepID=UPI0037B6B754
MRERRRLLGERLRVLGPELVGFAAAGVCAYAVDLGLFVCLRGAAGMDPISAKALSFVAGCSVAYVGNALGTYRKRVTGASRLRQYGVFFAVNVAGALVQVLCIAVSHYVLGFTSPRADTVSGAGVGMALATVVRFWGTRTLAFGTKPSGRPADEEPTAARRVRSGVPVEPVGPVGPVDQGRRGSWIG